MPCENFVKMGFEGSCPIQPGEYKQKIFIPVPDFKVPIFLTAVSRIFIFLIILFFAIARRLDSKTLRPHDSIQ